MNSPRFSVVIPAFNEERFLPRLLATLAVATSRAGPGVQVEIIVADNASTDATAGIALAHGCQVARVEKRAIAAARNGGARLARGDVLCFVDADMQVHPDTFAVIDRAIRRDDVVGGATGVSSERWSLGIAVTWAVMLPMVWLTGMDTGVVFCRRVDFEAIGGYDEGRLYAEDVVFLVALRRRGGPQGRRLFRPRGAKAVVSARKFDRHGDWHMLASFFRLLCLQVFAPAKARREAWAYWYDVR